MFSNPCNTVTDESSDCISAELMENDRLLLTPHSVRIQWAVFGSCQPPRAPSSVCHCARASAVFARAGSEGKRSCWYMVTCRCTDRVELCREQHQRSKRQGDKERGGKSWTVRKGTGHIRGGWKKWTFHLKFDSATGRSDGAPWTW